MSLIQATWSSPTGVMFSVSGDSAAAVLADITTLNGTKPNSAVTPEKQEAARASTAAGKTEKAAAETRPVAETAKSTPTVDYPTLQKAVFALVKDVQEKGLVPADHVHTIAQSFGYATFAKMKEAGPEGAMQFAAALDAVKAKHAKILALTVEEAVA